MPRTIVDIPAPLLRELDRLRLQRHEPRAVLIRDAIAEYGVLKYVKGGAGSVTISVTCAKTSWL